MKNILRGSIIFTFILLITGCSKEYLDPVPVTSLSDLTVFETSDRILAQVNGMYVLTKERKSFGRKIHGI